METLNHDNIASKAFYTNDDENLFLTSRPIAIMNLQGSH